MNRIAERIQNNALDFPERPAYTVHGKTLNYGALWRDAQSYAQLLQRQGTSPVLIYGDKELHVVISILSCLIAGRAYVPLRTDTPLARIRQIAALTDATLMLTERSIAPDGVSVLRLNDLTLFSEREKQTSSNRIVYMIFTSGSTGEPKGVPISEENLENFVDWISGLEPLRSCSSAKVFNQASFSFDLSVADFYYALCNGHTLVALADDVLENPKAVFRALAETDVAVMTPTFARLCLLYDEFRADNGFQLKCVYFCGELLDVKTVRKLFAAFPTLTVINAYGPTEATSAVTAVHITPEMAATMPLLPVGEVDRAATDIAIENGEIVLRGKSVFGGYLGGAVGGRFQENGVNGYRTGDLGKIEDGKLFCLGRCDRQIKYMGYRIELDDVERNLDRISGVQASAVIAKTNPDGAVRLIKAFAVTDGKLDEAAIKDRLSRLVPDYMIPKSIRIVDRLPVNENGKTDRKVLQTW